jgi:ABC-type phosphate/phosphonate transport system substrate-binding protein
MLLVLLAFTLSMWNVCAFAKSYTFGVAMEPMSSSETTSTRQRAFEVFVKAVSERLQEPVTLQMLATTGEVTRALELGLVDMAFLKTVPYGRAKSQDKKLSGLVTVVSRNENEEKVTHSGYIVALRTSQIDNVADLKGKRFGFIRDSASGLAYPISYLSREGVDYKSDFSQHRCYRNQHELIEALKAGEIDAGPTFRSPLLKRNEDLANLKVIARVPNVPNPLIAASASLSTTEKQKLMEAFTNLPESAFQGLRFFGLKALDEKLYEPVVELSNVDVCN